MNELTIKGRVHKSFEIKTFGANGFRKHEGQEVSVRCRIHGREWEKDGNVRYFPSVQGLEVIIPAETGDAPMPI